MSMFRDFVDIFKDAPELTEEDSKVYAIAERLSTRLDALVDRMGVTEQYAQIPRYWHNPYVGIVPIVEALLDRIEKLEAKL